MQKTEEKEERLRQEEEKYKCKYCYKTFSSEEDRLEHEEIHRELERRDNEG